MSKIVLESIITLATAAYKYALDQGHDYRLIASFRNLPEPAKQEDLGFVEMLKLRLLARSDVGGGPCDRLEARLDGDASKPEGPFRSLSIEENPSLGRVLVECKKYSEVNIQQPLLTSSMRSMQKPAELLSSSKSTGFHTLTCLGSFREPQNDRYGLVFEILEGSRRSQIALREIVSKTARNYRPTLSQRFQVLHYIAKTILKWHLVDWVHLGIASHNIASFYDDVYGVDYLKHTSVALNTPEKATLL